MAGKLKRREAETFSLSFMDIIFCGFGAMILLLVLTELGQPTMIERSRSDFELQLKKLQEELFLIRGDSERLERRLRERVDVLRKERLNLARAAGEISTLRGQYEEAQQESIVSSRVENELLSAFQELQEEKTIRSQRRIVRRPLTTEAVGGIPVDSDHVIFLIDTSPSMRDVHWATVVRVMQEILSIYPQGLKGIQVLDDEGVEMLYGKKSGSVRWLEDSKETRNQILAKLKTWEPYSDSNPANGIQAAIEKYYSKDKKISIYVLGDDFNGESIQEVADFVDQANKPDEFGRRRVRIHGIGFPHSAATASQSMRKFPALMRVLAERNDGTFIGLTNVPTCEFPIRVNGVLTCISGR
jgi:hypothetical protein